MITKCSIPQAAFRMLLEKLNFIFGINSLGGGWALWLHVPCIGPSSREANAQWEEKRQMDRRLSEYPLEGIFGNPGWQYCSYILHLKS